MDIEKAPILTDMAMLQAVLDRSHHIIKKPITSGSRQEKIAIAEAQINLCHEHYSKIIEEAVLSERNRIRKELLKFNENKDGRWEDGNGAKLDKVILCKKLDWRSVFHHEYKTQAVPDKRNTE